MLWSELCDGSYDTSTWQKLLSEVDFQEIFPIFFQRIKIEVMIFKKFETGSRYYYIQKILRSPPFCQESKNNKDT